MLEIREMTDKKIWEDFMLGEKPHTFLQSWSWGEFNALRGNTFWRLGMYKDTALIGAALVEKISARRGTFLYIPHGPLLKNIEYRMQNIGLRQLADFLKNLAKKEHCSFVRISPLLLKNSENEKMFKDLRFRKAPMHMHAELMWLLDVLPSEEELLRNMRKTTRYEIRRAEKEGVQIMHGASAEYREAFSVLYRETADRQRFHAFSKEYLEAELEAFKNDNQIEIFLAKYNDAYVSGAMVIFYGDSAFYHQGASSSTYPKVPAPYLLQWEIIKEAKKRGLQFYNFWGISPENESRHPWAGLSLFKKGFGGFAEEYVPARDLIINPVLYALTYAIEKARKIKRRL